MRYGVAPRMTNTTANTPVPAAPGDAAAFLATWPGGRGERRLALAVVLASLAFFLIAAPFAKTPLAPVFAFIPIYEAALVINDLITALLLFSQFRIARSRAVLVLASGYLFTAFTTVAHALTFPGLFAPGGLLGAGPQSTAWLYMVWHGGFPLFVIAYTLLRRSPSEALPARVSSRSAIVAGCLATTAVVVGFTLLTTSGRDVLPPIMQGNGYAPAMIIV